MIKSFFVLTTLVILTSCGSSKNDLMAKLVNEKKSLEDSLSNYSYKESEFNRMAKTSMRDPDTTLWRKYADSSTIYYMASHRAKDKLAAIDFSIDSLSKMR